MLDVAISYLINSPYVHRSRSCISTRLTQSQADSKKYTQSLVNGHGAKAQIAFRKLKWSLYSTEHAQQLEQRLSTHMEAFDRYLLAIHM
jgi:hypothetical protein